MNQPAAGLLWAALLLCGCENDFLDLPSCGAPQGPPCQNETCPSPCVPIPLLGWSLPVLLWSGPELLAPGCPPDRAGIVQYEGHADPNDPPECPSCSCEPPIGECALPSLLTASTQICGVEGPAPQFYDFSGLTPDPTMCNTTNSIPAGLIYSMTLGPLTMIETGCKPVTTLSPRSGAAPWKTFARACGTGVSPCQDPDARCIATAEPPPGYSQCIYQEGERECPSVYPNQRVFYDGISDSRRCSECSCGAPEGGECSAYVRVYQDALCTVLVAGHLVSSDASWVACDDIVTSHALGGKTSTAPVYEPGTCEPSGGEQLGSVELLRPSTFCCQ